MSDIASACSPYSTRPSNWCDARNRPVSVTTHVNPDDHRRQLLEVTEHGERLLAPPVRTAPMSCAASTEMHDLLEELG